MSSFSWSSLLNDLQSEIFLSNCVFQKVYSEALLKCATSPRCEPQDLRPLTPQLFYSASAPRLKASPSCSFPFGGCRHIPGKQGKGKEGRKRNEQLYPDDRMLVTISPPHPMSSLSNPHSFLEGSPAATHGLGTGTDYSGQTRCESSLHRSLALWYCTRSSTCPSPCFPIFEMVSLSCFPCKFTVRIH